MIFIQEPFCFCIVHQIPEVNLGSVGHADRDVGDGEHGGVGEAAGEGNHLRRGGGEHLERGEGSLDTWVISLMREGCLAADTALMNLEYILAERRRPRRPGEAGVTKTGHLGSSQLLPQALCCLLSTTG